MFSMRRIPTVVVKLFHIPFIYLCTASLWILVGNEFLHSYTLDLSHEAQLNYQNWKGITFVGITTIMLFLLLKQEQKKLLSSEIQYRSLFANNPNPMYIFNMDTKKIIKVNNAASAKYGYSMKVFLGMTMYDIRPERYRSMLDIALMEYKEKHKSSGRLVHRKKSGEEFTVSIISHKVRFNNQDCIMVLAIDASELVEKENKLKEAFLIEKELNKELENNALVLEASYQENFKLGEVLGKINNMVVILDKDIRITWVNTAFTQFTGYTLEEIKGNKAPDLLCGTKTDLSITKALAEAVEAGNVFQCELLNYTKDKKEYWVELNVSPLFDGNGQFEGMISVENVITDRKEKERRINSQNKALREIAWMSSHRLRRPLASVLSLTEMLADVQGEQERVEYLGLLKLSSQELDDVSREIAGKINDIENSLI